MSLRLSGAAMCLAAMTLSSQAQAASFVLTANLSGLNETPANASPATGTISVIVDDVANTVAVNESWSGLTTNATAAHIHCCVPLGTNGPVVIPFTGFPTTTSGTYVNIFTTTPTNIAGILAGLAYANIHNSTFPGGEIRGQLSLAVPEPATWGLMIAGFAVAGGAMRRQRRAVRIAVA